MTEEERPSVEKKVLCCPYCDENIAEAPVPYCQACEVKVFYCPQCRQPTSRENKVCPDCGADIPGGNI